MKKNLLNKSMLLALVATAGFTVVSCSNDDDTSEVSTQELDAVDAIESSLSTDSGGMAKGIEEATVYADQNQVYSAAPVFECGQTYSTSFSDAYTGANYSYDYAINRTVQLTCLNGLPASWAFTATYDGVYDTPKMSSDDSSDAVWTVTGLEAESANVDFDGFYSRSGTQVSKVRNQNTFASTLDYNLDHIKVSKTTHKIVSGSATVSFDGTVSNGNAYSYDGTITFNGNDTATLVINGNTYTLSL